MNDPRKPELTFAQIREIMRPQPAENEPTGRLFRTEQKDKSTMNTAPEEKQLATINPSQLMQISSDVAAVWSEIVKKTAIQIKGRRYIRVEGWQALATAHGCVAGCRDDGFSAIGELRRISDGGLLAVAEGFVGEDEIVWFGGQDRSGKTWPAGLLRWRVQRRGGLAISRSHRPSRLGWATERWSQASYQY